MSLACKPFIFLFIGSRLDMAAQTEKIAEDKSCVKNGHSSVLFTTKKISNSSECIEAIAKNYNPVKNNYHPIDDALWNKNEQ